MSSAWQFIPQPLTSYQKSSIAVSLSSRPTNVLTYYLKVVLENYIIIIIIMIIIIIVIIII